MNGATKAAFLCVVFLGMGAMTIANTQTQQARPTSAAAASRSPSEADEVIAVGQTPRNAPRRVEATSQTPSVAAANELTPADVSAAAALPAGPTRIMDISPDGVIYWTASREAGDPAGEGGTEASGPRGAQDPPPQPCPEDTLFSQRCFVPEDDWMVLMPSYAAGEAITYENFHDVHGDIVGLTWYGLTMTLACNECADDLMTFEITFFEDVGGMPGAAQCSYLVQAYGAPTNMAAGFCAYDGFYAKGFEVDLPTPCAMTEGWVSIVYVDESPRCLFLWLGSPAGERALCTRYQGELVCWEAGTHYDVSLCLLGSVYPGACCDDLLGQCVDGVAMEDCLPPSRFVPGVACDDLDPPCGEVSGACCEGAICVIRTPSDCLAVGGAYRGDDVPCDPNPCMGACCPGDHLCEVRLEADCLSMGAMYAGDGTTCDPNPCPPLFDECVHAEPVDEGTYLFDNTYATGGDGAACDIGNNVWFCYTAAATGLLEIAAVRTVYGTDWRATVAVYEGCGCDPLLESRMIACDGVGIGILRIEVEAGAQYLIEVGDHDNGTRGGPARLTLSLDVWAYGACCTEIYPYCVERYEPECRNGVFAGDGTTCEPIYCNGNPYPDMCDVLMGLSQDCNGNGVPDECDIADGTSGDYDQNGVPDECDPDCNGNGIPDPCDADCQFADCAAGYLNCGGSADCQADGIPDECQIGGTGDEAILWDNTVSAEDLRATAIESQDGGRYDSHFAVDDFTLAERHHINAFHTRFELSSDFDWTGRVRIEVYPDGGDQSPDDSAGPAVVLWIPTDGGSVEGTSLGEGILGEKIRFDVTDIDIELEAGTWWIGIAIEGNGTHGDAAWMASRDDAAVVMGEVHYRDDDFYYGKFVPISGYGYGIDVLFTVGTTIFGSDCDGNGYPDDCDIRDCDGSRWCLDCDQNGIPDGCEADCNGNGVTDACDIRDCDGSAWCLDCNANGVPDACDIRDGTSFDYDLNDVPDECDPDCNGNGVVDACDVDCAIGNCSQVAGCGQHLDCQADGIPDECQLSNAFEYLRDTGYRRGSTGIREDCYMVWMMHYEVREGFELIEAVKLVWGSWVEGKPATVYLWSDPNGDGDPADAKVLASVETTGGSYYDEDFVTVDLPRTYVGPAGTSFFVGVIMYQFDTDDPARLDYGEERTGGWLGSDKTGIDPNNLAAAETPPYRLESQHRGMFMLRAVGIAGSDCNGNGIPDDCDLLGDLNDDGSVDYDDYVLFLSAFGGRIDGDPAYDACCDYDDSGAVGLGDYNIWLAGYRDFIGEPLAGPPSAPGPLEPGLSSQDAVRKKQRPSAEPHGQQPMANG